MARILPSDAQVWAEPTKLPITVLDAGLLSQIEAQTMAKLTLVFLPVVTNTWVDSTTTPVVVKSLIAMTYVSWFYNRSYSEDQQNLNDYAVWLLGQANNLMAGLIDGSLGLPGVEQPSTGFPSFYPNDNSSALDPTDDDTSLGTASFSMGQRF
jgi:hypothetical protein